MRIYHDFFNVQAELISDSYPFEDFADGAFIEVKSRKIVKGEVEVDVGCGNAFGGKNEEEEEGGAAANSNVEKVIDVVDAFGLEPTSFEKTAWKKSFKDFYDRVLATLVGEKAETFKKAAGAYGKHINKIDWDELSVYTSKTYESENNLVFSYYKKEEDEAPTFIYFLAGCKSYKV